MKIGIDLGTTNSAMAYSTEDGRTEIIENGRGNKTTPSVVLVEDNEDEEDSVVVGDAAYNKIRLAPDRVLRRTKQDINREDDITYDIDGTEYDPIDAAGYILGELKSTAEDKTGEDVTSATITVPYYFGNKGRKATKNAAETVGLEVEQIINEPTAACLSYIHENDVEGTVLVYDFGGGTFDATLVDSGANINVISTEGDDQLGGEEIDDALYEHVRQNYIVDEGYPDPENNQHKIDSLRRSLKDLKHDLSESEEVTKTYDSGEGMVAISITRDEFNDVIEDIVDKTFSKMDDLMNKDKVKDAGITKESLDNILLVGGSTRIPLVRERVEEYFGKKPNLDTDPDTVVARGAALNSAYGDERVELEKLPSAGIVDVLSHNLGVETESGAFSEMFEEDVKIPEDVTQTYQNPSDSTSTIIVHAMENGEDGVQLDECDPESLGDFQIDGVPGDANIDVTFDVEQDGTLHVEANTDDGKEGQMTIEDKIGLSEDEIAARKEGQGDKPSPEKEFAPEPKDEEDEENDE